ncbi:hypothetical protein AAG570_012756 [Ranatra chinensis]|uniref:Uncharacterized protein n=1 Tax=Ranatra chinensis TaxID=642074 RepID=A0ABD0YEW4_9HEMI
MTARLMIGFTTEKGNTIVMIEIKIRKEYVNGKIEISIDDHAVLHTGMSAVGLEVQETGVQSIQEEITHRFGVTVLEKLGIELKLPEGVDKDCSGLPSYYNPVAMNPVKYAEQMAKRKLLWSNATKQIASEDASIMGSKMSELPFVTKLSTLKDPVPQTDPSHEVYVF